MAFGCGSGSSSEMATVPSPEASVRGEVAVAVTNNTLARLRVHARYANAEPVLLGEVSTRRTRSFTFPWSEGELRIGVRRADATDDTPRWSQTALTVSPGDSLEFTLNTSARRTAQVVFRKVGDRSRTR